MKEGMAMMGTIMKSVMGDANNADEKQTRKLLADLVETRKIKKSVEEELQELKKSRGVTSRSIRKGKKKQLKSYISTLESTLDGCMKDLKALNKDRNISDGTNGSDDDSSDDSSDDISSVNGRPKRHKK